MAEESNGLQDLAARMMNSNAESDSPEQEVQQEEAPVEEAPIEEEKEEVEIPQEPVEEPVEETQGESVEEEESLEDIIAGLSKEYGDEPVAETTETPEEENSSLNTEVDFDALIAEKTGGKFKSLDELNNYQPEPVFASERIKKLNELELAGNDINEVLKFQSLNVDNYDASDMSDALELIKAKMRIEEPDLTDQEIGYELRAKFLIDDDMDEDDINMRKLKAKREASKAKKYLIDRKKQLEIPNTGNDNQKIAQKEFEAIQKQWADNVSEKVSTYNEEKFKIGESNELKFKVTDESKKAVLDSISNPSNFWNSYTKPDGTTDMDKLVKDITFLKNRDTLLSTAYSQGQASGAKDIVKKLTNARTGGSSKKKVANPKGKLSPAQQIARQLYGNK